MIAPRAAVALTLLLLLPALASGAAPLAVAATWAGGVLAVDWPPPPGGVSACVFTRAPDALLGCVTAPPYVRGPGSWDGGLAVGEGSVIEVRVVDAQGGFLAIGRATLPYRAYLPQVAR